MEMELAEKKTFWEKFNNHLKNKIINFTLVK